MDNHKLTEGFIPHSQQSAQKYDELGIWDNKPLWELVSHISTKTPQRIAIQDETQSLNYQQLLQAADQLAAGLQAKGFSAGERVVLQWHNDVSFATTLLGILRAGLVPVLTLPAHRFTEINHFVNLSGASLYITSGSQGIEDANSIIDQLQTQYVIENQQQNEQYTLRGIYSADATDSCDTLPIATEQQAQNFVPPNVAADQPALFLVSGGTTGLPKLIPRSHNDYRYNIASAKKVCQINQDDVYLTVLPAAHNFPLGCPGFFSVLSEGGKVVFTQDPSPDNCFELIEEHKVTVTALVPALAQLWTAATEWEDCDISSLRLLQVGGSKLNESDAHAAIQAFPNALQQVFGMAEGLICLTRIGDSTEVIASCQGRPMSDLDQLRVVNAQGEDVATGEEGELLTRGPYTLRGYYRAEQHNIRAFTPDGFYRSGDKVKILADGNVIVTGRLKDVVNRGGESIGCDEIEAHLLTHPSIMQAAVVALPDDALGEIVAAAIVCTETAPTLAQLRSYLTEQQLADFKLPEHLSVLASLPVTAVGKIDKKQLLKQIA